MKIIKPILTLVFALLCYIHGYAQADSVYAQIKDYKPANFKEVYLPNHKFVNPTIDFNRMVDDFVPEAKVTLPNQYEERNWNGKIKKITRFNKYPNDPQKQVVDSYFYNKEGLLIKRNFHTTTNVHFHYDTQNRLIRKETVRNDSDTLNMRQYSYNNKNQVTEYIESLFENGKRRSAHWKVDYDPGNHTILVYAVQADQKLLLVRKLTYNGNKVKSEEYMDGKLFADAGVEITYSENNRMISRNSNQYSYFYSYNKLGQNIKEINIRNGKTWDADTKTYGKNGYMTHLSHENPVSKSSRVIRYTFDSFNNKIYEASGPDANTNFYEYFYEIEYY